MGVLYVDECGEEGFGNKSSEWLIVGGVIQPDETVRQNFKDAYDDFKSAHMQDNWHFHFAKASHDQRLGFIHTVRDTGLRAMAVAIYKPSIRQQENFKKRYYLYFYALRFLLERATIWCRDHGVHDDLHVYLSTRRGLKVENLNDYLEKIITSPFVKNDKMVWSCLRNESIFLAPNSKLRGLQIADCVVSSLGKAIEPSTFGLFENRYILDLHPMFHHDNLTFNRAITVWPGTPADVYVKRLTPIYSASG